MSLCASLCAWICISCSNSNNNDIASSSYILLLDSSFQNFEQDVSEEGDEMVADTIESGEEIEDQIDTNSQENDEIKFLDHDGVSLSINNYWHADY